MTLTAENLWIVCFCLPTCPAAAYPAFRPVTAQIGSNTFVTLNKIDTGFLQAETAWADATASIISAHHTETIRAWSPVDCSNKASCAERQERFRPARGRLRLPSMPVVCSAGFLSHKYNEHNH